MKTLRIGLVLAGVLAARLTLGQEAAPEPAPAPTPSPSDPPPTDSPTPSASPSTEPAPPAAEPSPSPSAAFPEPAPPPASASAEFPAPPPPPASASAAAAKAPSASVAASALPPPVVPPPAAVDAQSKQSAAPTPDDAEKNEDASDDTNGVFGPFRLGPVVGVGLPAFLSFGGALKLTKYFGAGITYGIVPTLQFAYYGDATVSYQGIGIYGHIHPFGGGFFLGAGVGYAHVRGTYTDEFDVSPYAPAPLPGVGESSTYTSEATMQTLVLTPELGYFFTFKSGFTMGVEAGLQIPIAPSEIEFKSHVDPRVPQQVVDQYVTPNDERVARTLEKLGQTMLPTIGIKMGWLF